MDAIPCEKPLLVCCGYKSSSRPLPFFLLLIVPRNRSLLSGTWRPPFLASSPPHLLYAASILCRHSNCRPGVGVGIPPAPWSGTPAFFLRGVYGRRLDFGLSSYVTLPDPTVWCNASLPAPALTITKPWFEILDCGNTAENLPTFYPRLSVKKIGFSGDLGRNVSQQQLHTTWLFATTILARCQTFAGWRVLPWKSSDFPSSHNTDVIHKLLIDPHHQNHHAGWLFLDRETKTFCPDRTSSVNRAEGKARTPQLLITPASVLIWVMCNRMKADALRLKFKAALCCFDFWWHLRP